MGARPHSHVHPAAGLAGSRLKPVPHTVALNRTGALVLGALSRATHVTKVLPAGNGALSVRSPAHALDVQKMVSPAPRPVRG
jgi:hypothetical protein